MLDRYLVISILGTEKHSKTMKKSLNSRSDPFGVSHSILKQINCYIDAAIGYKKGIYNGNSKLSEMHFNNIENVFKGLKSYGNEGLDEIAKLLCHEEESVRLWASSHLLNYPKYKSLKVLNAIKDSGTILALTAEVTLDMWKSGKVKY